MSVCLCVWFVRLSGGLSVHVCVCLVAGGLDVKILPRTAKLDGGRSATGTPPEQDIPLDIPKRTAVYIQQVTAHCWYSHLKILQSTLIR